VRRRATACSWRRSPSRLDAGEAEDGDPLVAQRRLAERPAGGPVALLDDELADAVVARVRDELGVVAGLDVREAVEGGADRRVQPPVDGLRAGDPDERDDSPVVVPVNAERAWNRATSRARPVAVSITVATSETATITSSEAIAYTSGPVPARGIVPTVPRCDDGDMKRALLLVPLAALVAALAAGCGGVSLDPVAKAAAKTADAGSFRFSFRVSLGLDLSSLGGGSTTTGGQDTAFAGDGAWDASSRRLQVGAGVQGQRLDAILDVSAAAPALYVKEPSKATWGKIDLAQAAKQGGVDLGKLTSAQLDPKQLVEMLKQSGASTKVGEETIDGVQTTHYRVEIDPRKALAGRPAQQQKAGEQALKATGIDTLPVDVWVDGGGYLRRVAADLGGTGSLFTLKAAMDLTDYGADVHVDLPPADRVEAAPPSLLPLAPKG
jgi:hypothetical protein